MTINQVTREFILRTSNGYQTISFNDCFNNANSLAAWLAGHGVEVPTVHASDIGRADCIAQYRELLTLAEMVSTVRNVRFPDEFIRTKFLERRFCTRAA